MSVTHKLFLFFTIFLLSCGISSVSHAEIQKKVLLLHSYHSGYKWTDDITTGLQNGLKSSVPIDLRIEHLDTKRTFTDEFRISQLDYLKKKYSNLTFDVIVSSDNNALSFLLEHRKELFTEVPIVFCGVNFFRKELLKGHTNVTGVNETIGNAETIELMLKVHPTTRRIIVINDGTTTGRILNSHIKEISNSHAQIEWIFPEDVTIGQLQTTLSSLQPQDLVFLSLFLRDSSGRHFEFDESAKLICESSVVPVYGITDFYLGRGIAGGFLTSGNFQGEEAAKLVRRILSGEKADAIPVIMESPNHYFADYEVLEHYSIDKTAFPEETIIINDPPNFYRDHKVAIWLTLTLLTLLSILSLFLTLTLVRKKKAENELLNLTSSLEKRVSERTEELLHANKSISDREEQIKHLISNLSGMVYRCCNDENWTMLFISEGAHGLTGYSPNELLHNRLIAFAEVIHEKDKEMVGQVVEQALDERRSFAVEYRIRTKTGEIKWVWEQGQGIYEDSGEVLYLDGIITDITDRKEMEQEQRKLATAIHQTDEIILITDLDGNIEYANPAFEKISGYSLAEAIGENPRILKSGKNPPELYTEMWDKLLKGEVWRGRLINKCKNDSEYIAEVTISPIRNQESELVNYVGVQRDITHEINLERNLRQAQKLEAMGTLAGGIAHEINTPAQFVTSNLDFSLESMPDLQKFIKYCHDLYSNDELRDEDGFSRFAELYEDYDIDYLMEELPLALQQSQEGIQQISKIVLSMKQFAHPGEEEKVMVDINDAIQNIATVCRNEWKYVADIDFQLTTALPPVSCNRSEINQVLLNIIVNAAHAMGTSGFSQERKGKIIISSKSEENEAIITIKDNGGGIPEDIQGRVFDPFFTTKEVGKGTGQGLSIAHSIITDKHDGKLYFESSAESGTTFFIHLPLADNEPVI